MMISKAFLFELYRSCGQHDNIEPLHNVHMPPSMIHIHPLCLRIYPSRQHLGDQVLHLLNQPRQVGADNLVRLLAVHVEKERRHGANAKLLAELAQLIDVELEEVYVLLDGLVFGEPVRTISLANGGPHARAERPTYCAR